MGIAFLQERLWASAHGYIKYCALVAALFIAGEVGKSQRWQVPRAAKLLNFSSICMHLNVEQHYMDLLKFLLIFFFLIFSGGIYPYPELSFLIIT